MSAPIRQGPLLAHENISVADKIVIADTNVILDFLEGRDKEVASFVKRLIKLSNQQLITLGTTIHNLAEVIDKELEIKYQLEMLRNKLTPDTILRRARDRKRYYLHFSRLSEDSIRRIFGSLNKNISKMLPNFVIFWMENFTTDDYDVLERLVTRGYLQSQDALMILTVYNLGAYLLSKDEYLVDSPIVNDLVFIYNPSDPNQRKELLKEIGVDYEG